MNDESELDEYTLVDDWATAEADKASSTQRINELLNIKSVVAELTAVWRKISSPCLS